MRSMMLKSDLFFIIVKIFKKEYKKFDVESLYSYVDDKAEFIKIIDTTTDKMGWKACENESQFYSGDIYFEKRIINRRYISRVKNIIVLAETDGIICKNLYLTDQMLWNSKGMQNYLTNNIRASNEKKIVIKNNWKDKRYVDKGIVLVKMGSYNYFHYTFEVLARLQQIDELQEYTSWPLLIDAVVRKDERSVHLLNYININHRQIIWIERDASYAVGDAIIPAYNAWIPYREPDKPYIIDEACISYIRNLVLKRINKNVNISKVYIARGNNNRLVNESDLIEILKKNGFSIFNPDMGTLEDEISIFSEADIIVGCYGAAFTNAIYCKKTVRIMTICPFELQIAAGINLYTAAGVKDYHMIPAEMTSHGQIVHCSSFRVTEDGIDKILELSNTYVV
jgi:capsular polysaccharide biosynthesis protein